MPSSGITEAKQTATRHAIKLVSKRQEVMKMFAHVIHDVVYTMANLHIYKSVSEKKEGRDNKDIDQWAKASITKQVHSVVQLITC